MVERSGKISALPIPARSPAHIGEHTCDSALVGSSDFANGVKAQRLASNLGYGQTIPTCGEFPDRFVPWVNLEALALLRHDMLTLERGVRPPMCARIIIRDGLCEELITVAREGIDVDAPDFHRPEASRACLVLQVGVTVGRSDEADLPRLGNFLAPVRRPVLFLGP